MTQDVQNASFSDKLEGWLQLLWTKLLWDFAVGFFIVGCVLLGFQVIYWLKLGVWPTITLLDVSRNFLPQRVLRWIIEPTDWLGVSKIVNNILNSSAWFMLMALAVIFIYWALRRADHLPKKT